MEKLNNSENFVREEDKKFTDKMESSNESCTQNTIGYVEHAPNIPDYVRVIVITDLKGRKRKLCIPASLDLDRPKRPRTIFSAEQLQILEMEFEKSHFIPESRRLVLSRSLGLSETQIKVWFQNRRTKFRRDSSDTAQTRTLLSSFPWNISFSEKKTV